MYMYKYNEKNGLIEKIDVSIDKANDYSPNAIDEFLYNGAIITKHIGQDIFSNLSDLIKTVKGPIYVKPKYHIVEEKSNQINNYFLTSDYDYAGLPISFNITDIAENLYSIEAISYGDRGQQPYYLMTNLNGNSMVRYITDFSEKMEYGDLILYTFKF